MIDVINNIQYILILVFFFVVSQTQAERIWYESFSVPEKGIWGDDDGVTIHADYSGITQWSLHYDSLFLSSSDDYAKTVSTRGGRFEVRDIDSEITWISAWIDIRGFSNVSIALTAYETGSGSNESHKYLEAFYRLDQADKIRFAENSLNAGNWGSSEVRQTGLGGDSLQLIIQIANHYAADKVTLDEITVTGESSDRMAPFVTAVHVKSADSLLVFFNEPVCPVLPENIALFSGNSILPVLSLVETNPSFLFLIIPPAPVCSLYLVTCGISDLSGNRSTADTIFFSYLPPVKPYDVVINEILADPSPPRDLPEYEFVELYNRAPYPVHTREWRFSVNNTSKTLDDCLLAPGDFVILVSPKACDPYALFGRTLGVQGFPSLINRGASLKIISGDGLVIDAVDYSEAWPGSPEKREGGWSLEKTDPHRSCGPSTNWQYAESLSGGTPGSQNSVYRNNPDNDPPKIIHIEAANDSSLILRFSEPMDTFLLKDPANYEIKESGQIPGSMILVSESEGILFFANRFKENKTYTLQCNHLRDPCGNSLAMASALFTWVVARNQDVVINEILTNPYPEGTDFLELFNASDKNLHLDHLRLSNGSDTVFLQSVSGQEILLPPGSYTVCTRDSAKTVLPCYSSNPVNIFEIRKFPLLYNNEGRVVLLNEYDETIDRFRYHRKLHSPFLTEITGISLERISARVSASDPANWHSAAEAWGFASPGLENSQVRKEQTLRVDFEPEAFSPNFDGYLDEYRITYHLDHPGYIAHCRIFDSSGRFLFKLAESRLLATTGFLSWNGRDPTGNRLPLGRYIVVFEIFSLEGRVTRFKDAVVLTDILSE